LDFLLFRIDVEHGPIVVQGGRPNARPHACRPLPDRMDRPMIPLIEIVEPYIKETYVMSSTLVTDLLDTLDKLSGGSHGGFRPVHAKGTMYSGSFTPSADAAKLTRAP